MSSKNSKPALSALDRLILSAIGDERAIGREDDPAKMNFSELWRWLSTQEAGRDHVKKPARLTIALGPEGVLISLVDSDLCCSVEMTCPHLEQVFSVMDSALKSDNPPIKSWGKKLPNLRKRKLKT